MKSWENTILLADAEVLTEWINRLLSYVGHRNDCTVVVNGICSCGMQALADEIFDKRRDASATDDPKKTESPPWTIQRP
jgi:hypothetical protein